MKGYLNETASFVEIEFGRLLRSFDLAGIGVFKIWKMLTLIKLSAFGRVKPHPIE